MGLVTDIRQCYEINIMLYKLYGEINLLYSHMVKLN